MKEVKEKILQAMCGMPRIDADDLSSVISCSVDTTRKGLEQLEEEGRIKIQYQATAILLEPQVDPLQPSLF